MPVIRRADAPPFSAGPTTFVGLAAPSRGSKETSVWEVTVPAGTPGLTHSVDREEIFVILSGRAVVAVDGVDNELGPGDAIAIPAHSPLSLANPFDEPVTAIAVLPVGGQARVADGEPFTPPWAA